MYGSQPVASIPLAGDSSSPLSINPEFCCTEAWVRKRVKTDLLYEGNTAETALSLGSLWSCVGRNLICLPSVFPDKYSCWDFMAFLSSFNNQFSVSFSIMNCSWFPTRTKTLFGASIISWRRISQASSLWSALSKMSPICTKASFSLNRKEISESEKINELAIWLEFGGFGSQASSNLSYSKLCTG